MTQTVLCEDDNVGTADAGGGGATAAGLGHDDVALSKPSDDTGSETLARYQFQHVLAALAFVGALVDDPDARVVCELSEDFVILCGGRAPELVSVKHIEPSQGPWSLATIIERGGVRHLYERWQDADKNVTCRLKTNGGLKGGTLEAAAIRTACDQSASERSDIVDALCKRLDASEEDVHGFLDALTIEAELPKRDDLLPRVLVGTLPGLATELGWPPEEAGARFEVICEVVATASQSDVRAETREPDGPTREVALARAIAKKTVTWARVNAAWKRRALSTSLMVRKLERGGLGPTDVERCKRLREAWLRLERRWDPELPGESGVAAVRDRVQDLAALAEAEARAGATSDSYAAEMRTRLTEMVSTASLELAGETLSLDLVLGVAYDETDRCRIWWSDRFEVGTAE